MTPTAPTAATANSSRERRPDTGDRVAGSSASRWPDGSGVAGTLSNPSSQSGSPSVSASTASSSKSGSWSISKSELAGLMPTQSGNSQTTPSRRGDERDCDRGQSPSTTAPTHRTRSPLPDAPGAAAAHLQLRPRCKAPRCASTGASDRFRMLPAKSQIQSVRPGGSGLLARPRAGSASRMRASTASWPWASATPPRGLGGDLVAAPVHG